MVMSELYPNETKLAIISQPGECDGHEGLDHRGLACVEIASRPRSSRSFGRRNNLKPSELSPSEQLAFTTVRIECQTPAGQSTGTGFYFAFCRNGEKFIPAIVTNKHVVENGTIGRFHIHLSPTDDALPSTSTAFDIPDFEKHWIGHPDPNVDLCVMPIGPLLQFSETQGKRLFFIPMGTELLPTAEDLRSLMAIEEVIMIGFRMEFGIT